MIEVGLELSLTVAYPASPRLIEFCEKATRYYVEDCYPPGPPAQYTYEEIKADLDLAWQLIRLIQREADL